MLFRNFPGKDYELKLTRQAGNSVRTLELILIREYESNYLLRGATRLETAIEGQPKPT